MGEQIDGIYSYPSNELKSNITTCGNNTIICSPNKRISNNNLNIKTNNIGKNKN